MNHPDSVKIRVDLPNHPLVAGESIWADALGNDHFQIKNIPFYAYGLNYDDIVLAIATSEGEKPEVKRLLKASGHRTMRIMFKDEKPLRKHIEIIEAIRSPEIGYEGMSDNFFALNVTPEGDFDQLWNNLRALEDKDILTFETCEAEVDGSFDAAPESTDQ